MDDPIKLIFKFKNNNKYAQHHLYVFVGNVDNNIMKTLDKIKDITLYDAWNNLEKKDLVILEDKYGEFWYKKFYVTEHINATVSIILDVKQRQDDIIKKHGSDWFSKHIKDFSISDKKVFYSYDYIVAQEFETTKMKKKLRLYQDKDLNEIFTTKKKRLASNVNLKLQKRTLLELEGKTGGKIKANDGTHNFIKAIKSLELSKSKFEPDEFGFDEESEIDTNTTTQDSETDDDDSENIDDIEQQYAQLQDAEIDSNIEETKKELDKIIKGKSLTLHGVVLDFDISKDDLTFNEELSNLFNKKYITSQYILKDDTIKTIKEKICCSIKNSTKFGENSYILPSRQYLWSEYYYGDEINSVMLGQRWINKTALLEVDTDGPNNSIRKYEELQDNLYALRENIKRHGSKIKWEDNDGSILHHYNDFFTNNEIHMIDVYNNLGLGYDPTPNNLRNVSDVYFKIYFPRIHPNDIPNILAVLNNGKNREYEDKYVQATFNTINSNIIIENEVMRTVESVKDNGDINKYKDYFKEQYITQTIINLMLRLQTVSSKTKYIDLFRVFSGFSITKEYPFVQYQTMDGKIVFKYSKKHLQSFIDRTGNMLSIKRWFENAPYGLSIKVMIDDERKETYEETDKYMTINITEHGKVDYKVTWKEEGKSNIETVKRTYKYIYNLIGKINGEDNKTKIEEPHESEFKFAFINSTQKFQLPEKFTINHNDLSNFSRYFFPYVALVIDPKKRIKTKTSDDSAGKFGTYLRYKRINKYDDLSKIEQRILYIIRNYDYNDDTLADEISKQFNITIKQSENHIKNVKSKFPKIKRKRKVLKKLESLSHHKHPGISIDIQGKTRENYKIRIQGSRDYTQLQNITTFLNVLLYLYCNAYLYKKSEYVQLIDKLSSLTNIAERRNKVVDFVEHETEKSIVKQMADVDERLKKKPAKGESHYSRECQQDRQPIQILSKSNVQKNGFTFNKTSGLFEKTVTIKGQKITLKAVSQDVPSKDGTIANTIYYTCDPKNNGDYMHIGFLTKSRGTHRKCLPCCFKKDGSTSKNKERQEQFMECTGKKINKIDDEDGKMIGDILYILKDTIKIQEGRFGLLTDQLDLFLNEGLHKTKIINRHYLTFAKDGYYFKYGTDQTKENFLNAVCACLDMKVYELKEKILKKLEGNKSLFSSLNNGDIKTAFKTVESFSEHIMASDYLDFNLISHLLTIQGVVNPKGLNIIVFDRQSIETFDELGKSTTTEDFVILCGNQEEIGYIKDKGRKNIILIREERYYYPIVMVTKKSTASKDLSTVMSFELDNSKDNIISYIMDFYIKNCKSTRMANIVESSKKGGLNAKKTYTLLFKLSNSKFHPKYQVLDSRNKCKYIITENSTIVPVVPSGCIFNLRIVKMSEITYDIKELVKNLMELSELGKIGSELEIEPTTVYYDEKETGTETGTGDIRNVIGIGTSGGWMIPIKEELIDEKNPPTVLSALSFVKSELYELVDRDIEKENVKGDVDKRVLEVGRQKYLMEGYELFRLEFSEFITKPENNGLYKKMQKITNDNKMSKMEKRNEIKKILYRIIDKSMLNHYLSAVGQKQGGTSDLVNVIKEEPKTHNYEVDNIRGTCKEHVDDRESCNKDIFCSFKYGRCNYSATKEMLIDYINKITDEIIENKNKSNELFNVDGNFVSDIVDRNIFGESDDYTVLRHSNFMISAIVEKIFDKNMVPIIGKKRLGVSKQGKDYQKLNIDNPLRKTNVFLAQNIIPNNLSLFRAYANGYYWQKQVIYDFKGRNLGFYSPAQTDIALYFRGSVVDWLRDNIKDIPKDIMEFVDGGNIKGFIRELESNIEFQSNSVVELFALNKLHNIPIIVKNENDKIVYVFDNGELKKEANINPTSSLNLRFVFETGTNIPKEFHSVYY